jgi:hypothetical protein
MAIELSEAEQFKLRRIIKRPRSKKQLYRAKALLALGQGQPIEAVARSMRVGVDRVEQWAGAFERLRFGSLAETDGPRPRPERDGPDLDAGRR